jgi:hypothetical protein
VRREKEKKGGDGANSGIVVIFGIDFVIAWSFSRGKCQFRVYGTAPYIYTDVHTVLYILFVQYIETTWREIFFGAP